MKPGQLELWGDYNSSKGQQLIFSFKMCTGHDYCKKETEIREWLRGKFIVVLHNQIIFDTQEYGEDAMVKQSMITYNSVSSQVREILPFKVQKTAVELQDFDFINLD